MIVADFAPRAGRPARECLRYAADFRKLVDRDASVRSAVKISEGTHGVWFDRQPHGIGLPPPTRPHAAEIDAIDRQITTLIGSWLSAQGVAA
jgi:hypothetical protein